MYENLVHLYVNMIARTKQCNVEHCWLPMSTLDYYKDQSSSLIILLGHHSGVPVHTVSREE